MRTPAWPHKACISSSHDCKTTLQRTGSRATRAREHERNEWTRKMKAIPG